MSNGIKIKDLPLLSDINGQEIIPTGGRGNFGLKLSLFASLIGESLKQMIDSKVNTLSGGTTLSHIDKSISSDDSSSGKLVLKIDGFENYSYRFHSEKKNDFLDIEAISFDCPQDGVYEIILDTLDIKDLTFDFDFVFKNMNTEQKTDASDIAKISMKYIQIKDFKKLVCNYLWVNSSTPPSNDSPYVSYDTV